MDRRALLAAERGTLHVEAETRVALVYPSPYRAAMSSLGYQQIYRTLNALPGVAADRAMLPDDDDPTSKLVTLETGAAGRQLSDARVLGRVRARDRRRGRDARARRHPRARRRARRAPSDHRRRRAADVLEPGAARAVLRRDRRRRRRTDHRRARRDRARHRLRSRAAVGGARRQARLLPAAPRRARAAGRAGRRCAPAGALADRRRRTPSSPTCS